MTKAVRFFTAKTNPILVMRGKRQKNPPPPLTPRIVAKTSGKVFVFI
ncbi:hypothetical protein N44_04443 [Microcystis aeruginosa NIES-44]|uniref:Uncharacterized protein n=1 Tax=Microcystis aeruginosa NIES-44 TaxID=449439 RepID=A0A0A1W0I5_MICAE|nr:hypothetical protein N44_04443 [Microcystis aeruginosa NIES-44]